MSFQRKRKDANHEVESGKKAATRKDKTQICLWVDAKQYKLLKIAAVNDGLTVTDILSKSINLYLNKSI